MDIKVSMSESNFINIKRFSSLGKLFKYASIISICSIMKLKKYVMVKNIRSYLCLMVKENVLLKSTYQLPEICFFALTF